MAIENFARNQPKSSAIGVWKMPKLARMEKPMMMMMQPATRTGEKSLEFVSVSLRSQCQMTVG